MEHDRQFTCERPEDVVQFLADEPRVPWIYEDIGGDAGGHPLAAQDSLGREKDTRGAFPGAAAAAQPCRARAFQPTDSWVELTSDSTLGDEADGYSVAPCLVQSCPGADPRPRPVPGLAPEGERPGPAPRSHGGMTTLLFRGYRP